MAGRAEIDGFDLGMRVGAAHDGHGERTLQPDIVDVGVASGDELGVLDALERTADVRSGHDSAARWYHVVSRHPRQPAAARIILYAVDAGADRTQAAELASLAGAIERWAADLALAEEPARFLAALESAAPEANRGAQVR